MLCCHARTNSACSYSLTCTATCSTDCIRTCHCTNNSAAPIAKMLRLRFPPAAARRCAPQDGHAYGPLHTYPLHTRHASLECSRRDRQKEYRRIGDADTEPISYRCWCVDQVEQLLYDDEVETLGLNNDQISTVVFYTYGDSWV